MSTNCAPRLPTQWRPSGSLLSGCGITRDDRATLRPPRLVAPGARNRVKRVYIDVPAANGHDTGMRRKRDRGRGRPRIGSWHERRRTPPRRTRPPNQPLPCRESLKPHLRASTPAGSAAYHMLMLASPAAAARAVAAAVRASLGSPSADRDAVPLGSDHIRGRASTRRSGRRAAAIFGNPATADDPATVD